MNQERHNFKQVLCATRVYADAYKTWLMDIANQLSGGVSEEVMLVGLGVNDYYNQYRHDYGYTVEDIQKSKIKVIKLTGYLVSENAYSWCLEFEHDPVKLSDESASNNASWLIDPEQLK